MAYRDSFIVSVLVNDKPLREYNSDGNRTCKIPFGSEYKLRLKNKSDARAMASISIDGTDVLTGKKIILGKGETVEIERFVDSLSGGRKFKFISLEEGANTGEIQDPTSEDNGLVEVKFFKEKIIKKTIQVSGKRNNIRRKRKLGGQCCKGTSNNFYSGGTTFTNNFDTNFQTFGSCSGGAVSTETGRSISEDSLQDSLDFESEKGATVEGSYSSQQFNIGEYFETYAIPTTIKIYLEAPIEDSICFGIFIGNREEPEATAKDKNLAWEIASKLETGNQKVTVKPI